MIFNQDCLIQIIKELYEDKNSLFSCLLVDRFWCRAVVPILWRDPWSLLTITNNINLLKRTELFVNIILLHLPEESRSYLQSRGIDIFLKFTYQQNPLFDYINFCRCIKRRHSFIDDSNIYDQVFHIYNNSQRYTLMQEIYKLFMSKRSKIKFLDITGILHPFYKYPGAETRLSEVYELHCKSNDDPLLFSGLAKICRLIERFFILYTSINTELARLIEIQQNVKYVKMIYTDGNLHDHLIDQAMDKHAHNLIYLDLSIEKNLNFLTNLFPKLINIQKLILHGSLFNNLSLNRQSISSFYPKLRLLQLCSISFSTIINIVQKTEGALQVIWVDGNKYDKIDQAGQLIRTISQHCPKLKYLKIFLKDQHLEDFKQLLINCQFLEGMIIYTDNLYLNNHGDELLEILIKFAPINLHKLELYFCKFKFESLNLFFNNWRNRKALWLYSDGTIDWDNGYLDSNNNLEIYKKKGVIQKYERNKSYKFIDDYKEIDLI